MNSLSQIEIALGNSGSWFENWNELLDYDYHCGLSYECFVGKSMERTPSVGIP